MSVLVILLGFSMMVAGGFLVAFLWATRRGQFTDKHTPAIRMLFDDAPASDASQTPNPDSETDRDTTTH